MVPFIASPESKVLSAGVKHLDESLAERGFTYRSGAKAHSSGGPFATGHFRKGDIEIGLIVRNKSQLGCPNYSIGNGYAGHQDVVTALGYSGQEELVEGEFLEFIARNGGDPFEALRSDLNRLILPQLDRGEAAFRESLGRAVRIANAKLGF